MIWFVALGSAVGGAVRYAMSAWFVRVAGATFPLGTLVINVTGSFLLVVLLRTMIASPAVSPALRVALTTGFCGGYTTFSTFSSETLALLEGGEWRRASLYVALSVILSLLAAFAGLVVARQLLAWRQA